MKQQKLVLIKMLLFVCFLAHVACTKEDENKPANFLVAKAWKRGMIDKNPSTNPSGRILYYAVQNCEKDDTFKFGSNNVLTITQGTNKCVNDEPATKTVAYSYDVNSKELNIDGIKFTIEEESKAQIKYYTFLPSATGNDYLVFLLE